MSIIVAAQWKDKFEEAKHIIKTECALYKDDYVTKKDTCSETSSSDDEEEEDSDKHEELIVEKTDSDQKIVIDKLAELNVTK